MGAARPSLPTGLFGSEFGGRAIYGIVEPHLAIMWSLGGYSINLIVGKDTVYFAIAVQSNVGGYGTYGGFIYVFNSNGEGVCDTCTFVIAYLNGKDAGVGQYLIAIGLTGAKGPLIVGSRFKL